MASIRRTLSPMPRAGAMHNGELYSVCSSPLSKSSSCNQDYPPLGGSLSSLSGSMDSYSVLYRLQAALLGIITRRFRTLERSKSKGQLWRRALFHFFICFLVGIFIGLTPLISTNISINLGSKHQAFSFEVLSPDGNAHQYDGTSKKGSLAEAQRSQDNASLETWSVKQEQLLGISNDNPVTQLPFQDSDLMDRKLLIIVTPTYTRLFQAYYLNRLAQTLRLVSSPLLWIVVEMFSQSAETADILRRTGVMYRHLACYKNLTSVRDRRVHQRNVALSHIETHRLYGIVYFADDDNMYSVNLFEQMREIRRFGTWPVALLTASRSKSRLEGPVCNDSQVIGWHTARRNRRFHSAISGFAFNSTIIWEPKRWHRTMIEPIRQLDTVKEEVQESMFIEQVVEDESQMEGLGEDCSRIMVWHLHLEASYPSYPDGWFMKKNLDTVAPLL
ncbi:probable beta-1,4-xylosyltransferase IRX9H isoform X1 [Macadamia integrifolia]|uniref:probable beta-1,4-xylosyltransferase IRX9H isoform X1 n=1 Tax=Macadamia integrifolia TaxID=60698 RepID=UPI001C4F1553|nr:probable beta-1,4-xylosyltransferase IRX9H isoform X1 [Macadamia integrifolia]XP_042484323.1 probable beta-1,4-xylosyltransferase IRX9H isoform X1 [Macadamia integrifolia]